VARFSFWEILPDLGASTSKKFTKTAAKLRELFCLEVASKNLKARKALLESKRWGEETEDQGAIENAAAAKITVLGLLQGRVREKFSLQLAPPSPAPASQLLSNLTLPLSRPSSSPASPAGHNACSDIAQLQNEKLTSGLCP